jgi:hypothetical protein
MLEVILQRSLSASSLLKLAAVRVLSSGLASPTLGEKKRIHFNEQVEQYIALEIKDDDDAESDSYAIHDYDDSDSDDGAIMMKMTNSKRKLPPMSATLQASFNSDNKMIVMLPSTTLKYREYNPESPGTGMEYDSGFWNSCKLSPPLQGTHRPSSPVLLWDDFEENDVHMDQQRPSAFANRKDSMTVTQEQFQTLHTYRSFSNLNGDPLGTFLCMFMPYEDEVVSESLFGKVINTINAVKDIAYVIWNVG